MVCGYHTIVPTVVFTSAITQPNQMLKYKSAAGGRGFVIDHFAKQLKLSINYIPRSIFFSLFDPLPDFLFRFIFTSTIGGSGGGDGGQALLICWSKFNNL